MGEMDEIRPQLQKLRGGKYRVEAILGAGGFGITYRCTDASGRVCAVKEYMPEAIASRDAGSGEIVPEPDRQAAFLHGKKRFLEEAQLLMGMNEIPGVVHVEEAFEENNTAYYVMEYLEGRTLKQVMRALGGRLPYAAAVEAVVRAGTALDEIHSRAGIFHRDISPENIMIMPDGSVKIIDFGSAKAMAVSENQQFSVVLKPGFAPPEQYASNLSQGSFTDVYALAGTFYYAVSGKMIPVAPDRVMGTEYESLEKLVPECGRRASEAVDHALLLDARFRTQTMREFVEGIAPGSFGARQEAGRREPASEKKAAAEKMAAAEKRAAAEQRSVSPPEQAAAAAFPTQAGGRAAVQRTESVAVTQQPDVTAQRTAQGAVPHTAPHAVQGAGESGGPGIFARSRPCAWLRVRKGACAGQRFSIAPGRTVTVGRSGAKSEIRLGGHPEISGLHFKLLYAREKHCFYVIDQSVNGLYYRSVRLEKGRNYKVMPQDEIGVGSMNCVIVLEEGEGDD